MCIKYKKITLKFAILANFNNDKMKDFEFIGKASRFKIFFAIGATYMELKNNIKNNERK